MNKWAIILLSVVSQIGCQAGSTTDADTAAPATRDAAMIGSVERHDPRFDAIVPTGARFEVLASGHLWTEGPVWVPELQSVLYSDIPNNAIYRWQEGTGASLWLQPSGDTEAVAVGGQGGSNGLALDSRGALLLAQHGDRRVVRLASSLQAPQPRFEVLVESADGGRFNSPNDLVPHSNGDLYFTDPPYGLGQGDEDPVKELEFNGVYRLARDGSLTLLISTLTRPNGIALSPDETVLYVASSDRDQPVIMAYRLTGDGALDQGRVFYPSWGDGMAVDTNGNVYVAGPDNGVIVLSPDGDLLGSLQTTKATSNCTFGDDGSSLYVTAGEHLLRMRLSATGAGFGPD